MIINIAGRLYNSLVNGPGIRYVLFTQGCTMHCDGCQNKHTWNKDNGISVTTDSIIDDIRNNPIISGITFSGGDPIEQAEAISELCNRIKDEFDLNIIVYTGRKYEQLLNSDNKYIQNILNTADYLIDGKFEKDNTEGALKFTGSANQRIIDLKTKKNISL